MQMKCNLKKWNANWKKNEMHFEKKEVQFEKIRCNLKNMKCNLKKMKCNLKKMKCDLNKMKCQIILVLFSYYLKQKNPFIANFENNSLVSEYQSYLNRIQLQLILKMNSKTFWNVIFYSRN